MQNMAPLSLSSKFQFKGDKILLILMLAMNAFSILVVYSTKGSLVLNHIVHLLVSYVAMLVLYLLDYRFLAKLSPIIFVLAVGALLATISSKAVRGISIFGRDVQTFYAIGFAVIIYMTCFIARCYNEGEALTKSQSRYMIGVMFLFTAGMAALNMSTAIIFFITCLVMFYIAHFQTKQLLLIVSVAVFGVGLLAGFVAVSMKDGNAIQIGRMTTFVNRIEYYLTKDNVGGYGDQMVLSRAAIARGGFHPAGPGRGVIKDRLPENNTDYAFASIYEEMGIVSGFIIVMLYMIFFYRAREISKAAGGPFGRLLSFVIGFWLTCQAFVHIGVNCNLLPTTGQTLPFISSGGSSLLVSGAAMGCLLNMSKLDAKQISKQTVKPRFVRGESER